MLYEPDSKSQNDSQVTKLPHDHLTCFHDSHSLFRSSLSFNDIAIIHIIIMRIHIYEFFVVDFKCKRVHSECAPLHSIPNNFLRQPLFFLQFLLLVIISFFIVNKKKL